MRHPAVWAIILNNFTFHYAFYVVMIWLPTYFDKVGFVEPVSQECIIPSSKQLCDEPLHIADSRSCTICWHSLLDWESSSRCLINWWSQEIEQQSLAFWHV